MTSFYVICGLGLLQSKIMGTPMNWRSPEKTFEDFFFEKQLRLCPWYLASSIPVLGLESVCPRKGCPWPWIFFCVLSLGLEPCVLDSTSNVKFHVNLALKFYNLFCINNFSSKFFKFKVKNCYSKVVSIITSYFLLLVGNTNNYTLRLRTLRFCTIRQ